MSHKSRMWANFLGRKPRAFLEKVKTLPDTIRRFYRAAEMFKGIVRISTTIFCKSMYGSQVMQISRIVAGAVLKIFSSDSRFSRVRKNFVGQDLKISLIILFSLGEVCEQIAMDSPFLDTFSRSSLGSYP